VGPSLYNPKKIANKFAGSLFFGWVQNFKIPRKLRGVHVLKIFGRARPSKSRETAGKPCFEIFWGPLKIAGHHRKIQILSPVHCGETAKNFWMSPSFKILRHRGKIRILRIFWGPQKLAGNHGKFQNFETCTSQENCKKIRISKPVPKISNVVNPPTIFSFLLTSASK
jgi:hypothetical protein